MKSTIFWVMPPCSSVEVQGRFVPPPSTSKISKKQIFPRAVNSDCRLRLACFLQVLHGRRLPKYTALYHTT
jgi:hypothetical protein